MNAINKFIRNLVRFDWAWFFLKYFAKFGVLLKNYREEWLTAQSDKKDHININPLFRELFKSKKVLHGPFQGMQYYSYESINSTIFPKLLGSYESEIHPIIEKLCQNSYTEIINIGCSEGYYAIGLGLRIRSAKIFAYDIDENARKLCKEMAILNNIPERINIEKCILSSDLMNFSFTHKGLIICDCEGCEFDIFNKSNLQNLEKCDLLIETHDFINIDISSYLINLFSVSHNISIIKSIDDIEKANKYVYEECINFDLKTKKELFREARPAIMEWLYAESKIKFQDL